jgi:hypothetical protein
MLQDLVLTFLLQNSSPGVLSCEVGSKMWLCCMQYRWNVFKGIRQAIEDNEGGLDKFSQGETPSHRCQGAG